MKRFISLLVATVLVFSSTCNIVPIANAESLKIEVAEDSEKKSTETKEIQSEDLKKSEASLQLPSTEGTKSEDNEAKANLEEKEKLKTDEQKLKDELLKVELFDKWLNELDEESLEVYLSKLKAKELPSKLKMITKEKANAYLKKKYQYTDEQLSGVEPVLNKNGNTFYIVDYKLVPHMTTVAESNEQVEQSKAEVLESKLSEQKEFNQLNGFKEIQKNSLMKAESLENSTQAESTQTEIETLDNTVTLDTPVRTLENGIVENADGSKSYEIYSMRDVFSKYYAKENGGIRAEINSNPVHYKVDDKFEEIELAILKEQHDRFEYSSSKNSYRTYFNEIGSLESDTLARFEKDNENGVTRSIELRVPNQEANQLIVDDNKIKFKNVHNGLDIEYLIGSNRLKENIYLNNEQVNPNFEFLLKLDGVDVKVEDKIIQFVDLETGEVIWDILQPYAEDSGIEQLVTHDMHYEIENVTLEGSVYKKFKLIFDDPTYLENAVYPITVDPTLIQYHNNFVMINANSPTMSFPSANYQCMIAGSGNGSFDTYIDYLNFSLGIGRNSVINTAQLSIYPLGRLGYDNYSYYDCKRVLSDNNSATWNSRPQVTEQSAQRVYSNPTDTKIFNVTSMLNDMFKNNQSFYGFEISGDRNNQTGWFTVPESPSQLLVDYVENAIPTIDRLLNVSEFKTFRETDTNAAIQLLVSDSGGGTLNTSLYIDGRYHSAAANNAPLFNINMTTLSDGEHKFRFVASDGYAQVEKTYTFYVDKSQPVITKFEASSISETSITTILTASDPGFEIKSTNPYTYYINGVGSARENAETKVFSGLVPGKNQSIQVVVTDRVGKIATKMISICTKSKTPVLEIKNIKSNMFDVLFKEGNGSDTQYQIKIGTNYVQADGTLAATASWVTSKDNIITVKGLTGDTAYVVSAKAKNSANVETAFSADINTKTSAALPDKIQNLSVQLQRPMIKIKWDGINNITGYELDVNGVITALQPSVTSYNIENISETTTYLIKIRGVNAAGQGEWTSIQKITPAYTASLTMVKDETYDLNIIVENMTTLAGKKFVLWIENAKAVFEDLCSFTYEKESAIGEISSEQIKITEVANDHVEFEIIKPVETGKTLSGIINSIRIKAIESVETTFRIELK